MAGLEFKNSNVQALRRLLADRSERHDTGCFVIEGPTSTLEAVRAGVVCRTQFVPDGSQAAVDGGGQVVSLAPGVIERVGSTKQPQPPLTVAELPHHDVPEILAAASFVVVVDRVGDPGNLGTIMRSAEAAGADAVVVTPGSVDPYNPKVVRSSASAIFHVPIVEATIDDVAASGLELFGTSSHEFPGRTVEAYTDADMTGRIAIVMGNEAAGLPDEWNDDVGPIARWVTIPHAGRSESLNVAMATTVLAFEAARQRSSAG
ncbi:MAG: RNA methyltransferase [Ilumatobacter sp.]|uniref:TrmH family RNA methyltransferase n=1 Tax=Ilumatobacter sp. TaxID=1967498 RepID=UPI003C715FAC